MIMIWLGTCVAKQITVGAVIDFAALVVGEASCAICTSPLFPEPTTKAVTCTACAGYRVWNYLGRVRKAGYYLSIANCVADNCGGGIYSIMMR